MKKIFLILAGVILGVAPSFAQELSGNVDSSVELELHTNTSGDDNMTGDMSVIATGEQTQEKPTRPHPRPNRMDSEKRQRIMARVAANFTIDGDENASVARLTTEAMAQRNEGGFILRDRKEAIKFLHANALTKFESESEFMADNALRRDEAAAFYVRFARDVLGLVPNTGKVECEAFNDLDAGHTDLQDEMIAACQLDLFKGSNGKFMPVASLTNAQAITVLIRLLDGFKDESGTGHRAMRYMTTARARGLTAGLDADAQGNIDRQITRGDIAKILEAAALIEGIKDQIGADKITIEKLPFDDTSMQAEASGDAQVMMDKKPMRFMLQLRKIMSTN